MGIHLKISSKIKISYHFPYILHFISFISLDENEIDIQKIFENLNSNDLKKEIFEEQLQIILNKNDNIIYFDILKEIINIINEEFNKKKMMKQQMKLIIITIIQN